MGRLLFVFVAMTVLLTACSGARPHLEMDPSVPEDLETLADETWTMFLAAFPAQHDCIGDATLVAAWELEDRARLDPDTRAVTIRVPATAPQLTESMVHEFGHLLEFACPDQASLRDGFREAERLDPDQDWFAAADWEEVPSEHWAEAVVQYVIGFRLAHPGTIPVTPAAVTLVAGWAEAG
jgi:hypothetical protein